MASTRRSRWLAFLLSLPLAGLGHLYAGSPRRAMTFFGGELLAMTAGLFLLVWWRVAPWNLVLGLAALHGWRIVAAVGAFQYAAQAPAISGRSAWLRWPAYAVVYLIAAFGPALVVRATAFEAFRVPTGSMSDTLLPGDRFLATKWDVGSPNRGDIVVYRKEADVDFVSRVIGLPGDRVEVRAGYAWVNGERLEEPYVRLDGTSQADFGPSVVPNASYFLLGDRRNHSLDSRMEEVGFVSRDRIFARARTIFWSRDLDTCDVRWPRLGRPLQ